MKCLLCKYFSAQNDEELRNHYISVDQINKNSYYLKAFFLLDKDRFYSKYCDKCKKVFNSCREKENHSFLQHYQQADGFANMQNNLPINVLNRGSIAYFSINYSLHSNFYNFFDAENTVDDFLEAVKQKFIPTDNAESQGSIYLVNYQPAQSNVIIELEDKRIWLTDVYRSVF